MSGDDKTYNKTSVILVHGIGDTSPGSVLDPMVLEIGKQLEGVTQQNKTTLSTDSNAFELFSQSMRWQNFQFDLIEYHWSGSAGKIRRNKFFASAKYLVSMLWNLPRLGAWGSQSALRHAFATFFGCYLVATLFVVMFFSGWQMSTDIFEPSEIKSFDPDFLDVLFKYLLFYITLIPAAAIGVFLSLINMRITQWAAQWLGVAIGNVMLIYVWIILSISYAVILAVVHEVVGVDHDFSSLVMLVLIPLAIAPFYLVVVAMAFVADLFRDVIHYLVVDKNGDDHEDTVSIKANLHEIIDSQIKSGTNRIVVIAHSLGTAISAEVLIERIKRGGQNDVTFEFVTCGSPLKRSLHRFLPQRFPHPDDMFDRLKSQTAFKFGSWINIYRKMDLVGKGLSSRKTKIASVSNRESLNGIKDVKVEPADQWPIGHGNYWGDTRFLNILIDHFLR